MAESRVKRENFIVLQGWQITDLKLKGNELIIYACIYGFSQEGQPFSGSLQYLADWTNTTKRSVMNCLKSLVKKGLIEKKDKVVNNVKFCEYYATKFTGMENNSLGYGKKFTGGMEKSSPNNIDINNISNNKEYIHTSEVAPVQLQGIVDMFNEICKSYPKVTKLSAARQKAIKTRLKVYSIEDFRELFTMAEQSHFLKGGNNRNWSANFDWLIKDANMAKVLDGNYNDSTNRNTYQNEPESQEDPQKDFEEYLKRYGLDKQEPIDWGDVDVPFK